ncbi:PH domain-containing protein [Paraburkholderia sp. SIMBA_009]
MTGNAFELVPTIDEPRVIFEGSPSQVVNLPTLIGNVLAAVTLLVAGQFASVRWHVTPLVGVVPALLLILRALFACLQTAFIEIRIDTERITYREGILNKEVSSVELFRIQHVTSFHPWWERPFGVGTVVVATSDSDAPRWRLAGLPDAEALRADLNRAAIALRDRKGFREVNMGRV